MAIPIIFLILIFLTNCTSPFTVTASQNHFSSNNNKNGSNRSIRTIPSSINLFKRDKQEDFQSWKAGESKANLFERLTFSYASPLMNLAKERTMSEEDSLKVPVESEMDTAVPKLESMYAEECNRALRKGIPLNDPSILVRALIRHQKSTLVRTGVLRLANTVIQAFPALLVSRLLRLVESGAPISQSIRAAVGLMVVLSMKMVTENQYFHGVVQCSTQVRGALSGILFDKALRLPAGGPIQNSTEEKTKKKTSLLSTGIGTGGVINLMQSDTSIIETTSLQLHTIWDGPLQIIIYTSLLLKYMGPSVLYGMAVLLMTIPMNAATLRLLTKLRKKENQAKDARTKRTAETIMNMKLLKLQGWESQFSKDIQKERDEELFRHLKRGKIRALNTAVSNSIPALVLVVTLLAYARSGRPIVASTVFTSISLLNQLRFPLLFYPMLIDALASGRNSVKRISNYLSMEEVTPYVTKCQAEEGGGGSIKLSNGNFMWSSEGNSTAALKGVELEVKPGEIVSVVGSVGAGKTALIKALLGELAPVPSALVNGSKSVSNTSVSSDVPNVIVKGSIAYCSQEAWLPKGTIRDAVVAGREFDEKRYFEALRDAGLDADFIDERSRDNFLSVEEYIKSASSKGLLTHETDVGEGGSSLSGGQRARIALARSLYDNEATVFLLDDPFAALDATVGSLVFERLTSRLRKQNAAVVLVTNDPTIPKRCDRVVLIGKASGSGDETCSKIIDVGTYEDLLRDGHDLSTIITVHEEASVNAEEASSSSVSQKMSHIRTAGAVYNNTDVVIESPRPQHADPDSLIKLSEAEFEQPQDETLHVLSDSHTIPVNSTVAIHEHTIRTDVKIPSSPRALLSADDAMSTGAVPLETYMTYFKSIGSPLLIFGLVGSFILANGAQFFQQYILAKWTELGKDSLAAALAGNYLSKLVQAAGVVSIFLWLRSYFGLKAGLRASRYLHDNLLKSVVKAPMSFFDATPSGQLLTRFGKELDVVDRNLPDQIGSVLYCFLQIFFSCAALAGAITPAMLLPLGVITFLYIGAMERFRPCSRDFKRCESKSRSPIYTHFGEALKGTETIRSMPGGVQNWSNEHRLFTDKNLSVFYSNKVLDRWLSVRLESLGNIIVFSVTLASILLSSRGKLQVGSAGWGLTQALSITGLLNWAVRCLTDFETQIMSVSRITEITDLDTTGKMPKEKKTAGSAFPSAYSKSIKLSSSSANDKALVESGWPWKGAIKLNNISMRYNEVSPLVLKNVSIDVPAGSTLGVVGRTGSGKSSLLLTLFRLVELDDSSSTSSNGFIEIDGIDIRAVNLETLRGSLSIIPQDPVLFAGSIFFNLDPSEEASEDDVWEALEAASTELAQELRNNGEGLSTKVVEGGKNFSAGQRQLICLARALLRKSNVLVMDEATSSVDSKTDSQVQTTIRDQFVKKGVTVITVAHRLDTVLGYDNIAVLGNGEVLEYGSPRSLLRKANGELRQLVDADLKKKQSTTNSRQIVI